MPQDTKKLCRRYGLTLVETADLALRRRRCGKGFSYVNGEGRTVRDKALKGRIKQLAIPPAWTEVCIAEDERAHIQAVGRDGKRTLAIPIPLRVGTSSRREQSTQIAAPWFDAPALAWCREKGSLRARPKQK
jgi:hypothetical protein